MSAVVACRVCRRSGGTSLILQVAAGVRVVVMSGFGEDSVADQVLAAGAIRYVEKGLRMNLAGVIDEVFAAV